jgi:kinesin family protein 13
VFVDGITKSPVDSFEAIAKVMATGEAHRSKGATLMNSESSRAHTVITIELKQTEHF